MRLTYILAAAIAATLHASSTALPLAGAAAIQNGASPAIVDSTQAESGRLLRRVEYDDIDDDDLDDDDIDEERGFGDAFKKMNPVTAVKKSAEKTREQVAKAKKVLADAADYERMMDKAKEMVYKL